MKQGAQRFNILNNLPGTSFYIRNVSRANLFFCCDSNKFSSNWPFRENEVLSFKSSD